jgi:hypothetical protein
MVWCAFFVLLLLFFSAIFIIPLLLCIHSIFGGSIMFIQSSIGTDSIFLSIAHILSSCPHISFICPFNISLLPLFVSGFSLAAIPHLLIHFSCCIANIFQIICDTHSSPKVVAISLLYSFDHCFDRQQYRIWHQPISHCLFIAMR